MHCWCVVTDSKRFRTSKNHDDYAPDDATQDDGEYGIFVIAYLMFVRNTNVGLYFRLQTSPRSVIMNDSDGDSKAPAWGMMVTVVGVMMMMMSMITDDSLNMPLNFFIVLEAAEIILWLELYAV